MTDSVGHTASMCRGCLRRLGGLFCVAGLFLAVGGCVSDEVEEQTALTAYQRQLADWGPQTRMDAEEMPEAGPLGVLEPVGLPPDPMGELDITVDPNTGQRVARLTIEEAVARTLANSPVVRVVSFDPEIARQDIAQEAGEFDPVAFGRFNYENQDSPDNSIFEAGQAETRLFESGIRQRNPWGSQWSASYALARIWDDLAGRTLPTRYEPMVVFELRQPLLRDFGPEVNLAGVNVARLNYTAALLSFREQAEQVAATVIGAYWRLVQARRDLLIQEELVEQTLETLYKVEGRRDIDATDVQVKQAESFAQSRGATLLEFQKRVNDAQDVLARLMSDPQLNLTSELDVVPLTEPVVAEEMPEIAGVERRALATAMAHSPLVGRARLGVEVAEINVEVAENQKMPRLDLVGSTRSQGLARDYVEAHDDFESVDYATYSVGLTFEYPLGNRSRHAEWLRRRLERRKAVATLHNTADQTAVEVKERMRRVRTSYEQVGIQRAAVEAARGHLETLEAAEQIRERLTPEFLLVKLQAQETYAQARRAEVAAVTDLNVALAELARTTGTVLGMRAVESSLDSVLEMPPGVFEPEPEKPDLEPPTPSEMVPLSPSF